MLKRFCKWMKNYHKWHRSRKQSDYRAVSMAVKLVITGALTPSTRVSTIARGTGREA